MKLRNKLIPLMSVVTATTCVAPIATSCGVTTDGNMVDITHNYVPTIDKAKKITSEMSEADAQDLYFQHLAENPEILAQDVYKYQADYLPSRIEYIEYYNGTNTKDSEQQYVVKNVNAKVGVSNISFRKVNYVDKSGEETVDKSFYALSCDIKYHFTFSALSVEEADYELSADLNMSASLHDIPTTVYAVTKFNPDPLETEPYSKVWRISNEFTDSKLLDAVPGWSYTISRKDTVTQTSVDEYGQKYSYTEEFNKNGVISRKEQIDDLLAGNKASKYYDEFLSFDSYHMSDVSTSGSSIELPYYIHQNDAGEIEGTVTTAANSSYIWYVRLKMFDIDQDVAQQLFASDNRVMLFWGDDADYVPKNWNQLIDGSKREKEEGDIYYYQEDENKTEIFNSLTEASAGTAHLKDENRYMYKNYGTSSATYEYNSEDGILYSSAVGSAGLWTISTNTQSNVSSFSYPAMPLTEGTEMVFKLPAGVYGYAYADYDDSDVFEVQTVEITDEIPVRITVTNAK